MKKYVSPELTFILMDKECICSISNVNIGEMESDGGWEGDYFEA